MAPFIKAVVAQEMPGLRLKHYRFLCVLIAVLVPALGGVYRLAEPAATDPMWLRGLIAGVSLGAVALSHAQGRLRRLFVPAIYALCYIIITWFAGLTVANGFASEYALGLLFTLAATGLILSIGARKMGPLVAYLLYAAALVKAALFAPPALWGWPAPQVEPILFLGLSLSLGLGLCVAAHWNARIQDEAVASAERFQAAAESSPDAFFLFRSLRGAQGEIVGFTLAEQNGRAERFLDRPREAALGAGLRSLLPFENVEAFVKTYTRVVESGEVFSEEVQAPVGAGGAAWLHHQAVRVGDGVAVTFRDVSGRRQAEAALREHRQLLASISENITEGIYRTMPEEGVVYANRAFAQMFGYASVEEALQVPAAQLYADPAERADFLERIAREGRVYGMEVRLRRADGSTFWGLLHSQATCGPDGAVRHIDGAVSDVTERKAAEARLRESEERYRQMFENNQAIKLVIDPSDGEILDANPAAAAFYGYPLEQLKGMNIKGINTAPAEVVQEAMKGIAQRPTSHLSFCHRLASGEVRDVEVYTGPVKEGGAVRLYSIIHDVTERRRAEEALRASEEQYRALAETAIDAIVTVRARDGRITYANGAAGRLFGYAVEDLTGRPLSMLVPERFRDANRKRMARYGSDEAPSLPSQPVPLCGRTKAGHEVPLEVSWSGFERDGERFLTATVRDVTARREYEQGLIAAKEEAEEMSRMKSTFLANMSHEIRTPLTSILGFSEVLAEEISGPSAEFVHLIRTSGERLMETLNSVLELARLESGASALRAERLDVGARAREAVALFEPQARRKNLALEVDAAPATARLDPTALDRVLRNLIANAIKFTEAGSVRVRVAREPAQAQGDGQGGGPGRVVLRVADTGVGIGEAFQARLFTEFEQESSGLNRAYDGIGLGLAITKRLVEAAGGTIEVESEKGVGSTFTVRFPACSEEVPAASAATEAASGA